MADDDPQPEAQTGATGQGHAVFEENPFTNFIRNSPFLFISVVVHIVVLMLLALVTASEARPVRKRVAIVVEEYEIPEEIPPLVREENLFESGGGGPAGAGAMGTESFEAAVSNTTEHTAERINILGITAPAGMGTDGDFAGEGGEGWDLAPGTGSGEGIEGAVDQFAIITINSMMRGETLVVLLVDRSRSIIYDDLPLVIKRMDHYFKEIEDHVPAGLEDRGRWVVVSYGRNPTFVCKPSRDLAYVQNALASVAVDVSGQENIGRAIDVILDRFGGAGYKYLLIAAMTDEAGDDIYDPRVLESVIKRMRQAGARFFVFGYESRFSARKKQIVFKLDPALLRGADRAAVKGFEGRTVYGWADAGPECPRPELWWSSNWHNWHVWGGDLHNIPSGFGMYGLNRMVLATNGIYFLLQIESNWDQEKMYSRYAPDICSVFDYDRRLAAHPLRRELKTVWSELGHLQLSSDLRTANQIDNALKKSYEGREFCIRHAASLRKTLKTCEPIGHNWGRWEAHADLTIAELLRFRFMLGQYHAAVQQAWNKVGRKMPPNHHLVLGRGQAPQDFVGPQGAKDEYDAALHYIDEVVLKHSGTPWGMFGSRLRGSLFPWKGNVVQHPPPPKGDGSKPPPASPPPIPPSLSGF